MSDRMEQLYCDRIAHLKAELAREEEMYERYVSAKNKVHLGTRILDLEEGVVKVVDCLKNGSNDFEARAEDGSYARGYHYIGSNYRVITSQSTGGTNK